MIIGVSVITTCLVFSIMLLIVYFSKKRINNMENKIYSVLIIINVIGLLLELLCCYFTYYNERSHFDMLMCSICNRIFIIYLLTWLTVFTFYIFWVTFNKTEKFKNNYKKYQKNFTTIALIIYIILFVLALFLPLDYYNNGTYVYSYGQATSLLVIFGGITILFDIFCVFVNRKNIKSKQYYPLFILIILMTIVLIIRNLNPGIILINSTFAFITALMFHTIENPDSQLISELYKNKKIIEKSNEDTSKFLFKLTQDIKDPIKKILEASHNMTNIKNHDELVETSKYINNNSNQLDHLINKALNISTMDTGKIKIFENRYNIYNLINEIAHRAQEEQLDKVKFEYTIAGNIPTYLYGDPIKLKQALASLIRVSEGFTQEGFIDLDINAIIKYNICRLVITLEDSGRGISIDRINQILSTQGDSLHIITEDTPNLDILQIKKVINMLGGSLMIKSEEGKGTTVTITLDQKIVETKETELSKRLDAYEQSLFRNKKILLIDDDDEELEHIKKLLDNDNTEVTTSIFGRDAIEKIRNKNKYNLIILDDELGEISALTILKELKKNENFKTPVVVMINDNKEKIKLHYLQDGFADTISKSKLATEIERISKRF